MGRNVLQQPEETSGSRTYEFAPQVSGSGECSSVFVHPDAGSGGTLSCREPAGNSDRRCCEDFVLAVPGEEEVRIPGFPRNESAVKLPNPKGSARPSMGRNVLQQPEETSGSRTYEFAPQDSPVSSRRRLTNPKG